MKWFISSLLVRSKFDNTGDAGQVWFIIMFLCYFLSLWLPSYYIKLSIKWTWRWLLKETTLLPAWRRSPLSGCSLLCGLDQESEEAPRPHCGWSSFVSGPAAEAVAHQTNTAVSCWTGWCGASCGSLKLSFWGAQNFCSCDTVWRLSEWSLLLCDLQRSHHIFSPTSPPEIGEG